MPRPAITTSTRPGERRRRSSTADVERERADGANMATSKVAEATPNARRPDKAHVVEGLITEKVCQPRRSARMVSMAISIHQPHEGDDIEPFGQTSDWRPCHRNGPSTWASDFHPASNNTPSWCYHAHSTSVYRQLAVVNQSQWCDLRQLTKSRRGIELLHLAWY